MNNTTNRRLARLISLTVAVFCVTACTPQPPAPSYTYATTGTNGFPASGITQEQLESVLKPGWYNVSSGDTEVTIIYTGCMIKISNNFTWLSQHGTNGYWMADKDAVVESWGPYMFYRFPSQFGWGGALWRTGPLYPMVGTGDDNLSRPVSETTWLVVILYDEAGNGVMTTLGGQNCTMLRELSNSEFATDAVSAVIQLHTYAWQGLAAKYPEHLKPVPSVNPSPYVPPPNGVWPSVAVPLPLPTTSDTGTPG